MHLGDDFIRQASLKARRGPSGAATLEEKVDQILDVLMFLREQHAGPSLTSLPNREPALDVEVSVGELSG